MFAHENIFFLFSGSKVQVNITMSTASPSMKLSPHITNTLNYTAYLLLSSAHHAQQRATTNNNENQTRFFSIFATFSTAFLTEKHGIFSRCFFASWKRTLSVEKNAVSKKIAVSSNCRACAWRSIHQQDYHLKFRQLTAILLRVWWLCVCAEVWHHALLPLRLLLKFTLLPLPRPCCILLFFLHPTPPLFTPPPTLYFSWFKIPLTLHPAYSFIFIIIHHFPLSPFLHPLFFVIFRHSSFPSVLFVS